MINTIIDYDTNMEKHLVELEKKHLYKELPKFNSIYIDKNGIHFSIDKYQNTTIDVWINKNTGLYNSDINAEVEGDEETVLNSKSIKQAVKRVLKAFGTHFGKSIDEPAQTVIDGLFI